MRKSVYRSDINQSALVRGLDFRIVLCGEGDGLYYVAKSKALISCMVTAKLIYAFVFICAKRRFSRDAAHITCHPFVVVRKPTFSFNKDQMCRTAYGVLFVAAYESIIYCLSQLIQGSFKPHPSI